MEGSDLDADHVVLVASLQERGLDVFVETGAHGTPQTPQVCVQSPGRGSLLWIARDDAGAWWVVTWGGHFYTVPSVAPIAELCAAVAATRARVYDLPPDLVARSGLTRRDDLPIFGGRRLEGWDAAPDEPDGEGEG